MDLALELAEAFEALICEEGTERPVVVECVERRGVWFVHPSELYRHGFEVVHAPTGGRLAGYANASARDRGEKSMRTAIDLMRALPEQFGAHAVWGMRGILMLRDAPESAAVSRLVMANRGHLLFTKPPTITKPPTFTSRRR